LFVLRDSLNIDIYEESDLDEVVKNGELKPYYSLLEPIGDTEKYAKLFNGSVVDITKNSVHHLKKGDKRSKDWNYVYLNGTKKEFTDGIQKIQTLDNYLEGNDVYEAEFKISFKKIAKEMGISTSGTSISEIYYF